MAEAQTFGSAVLRLISLDEEWRIPVAKAGVVRYVLPLLDAKLGPARWNSRQVQGGCPGGCHLIVLYMQTSTTVIYLSCLITSAMPSFSAAGEP